MGRATTAQPRHLSGTPTIRPDGLLPATGKAYELDRELPVQLTSFTESVAKTGSSLDELKTPHEAAIKAVEAENKKKIEGKKKGNGSKAAHTHPPTPACGVKAGKPVLSKAPQAPVESGSLFEDKHEPAEAVMIVVPEARNPYHF